MHFSRNEASTSSHSKSLWTTFRGKQALELRQRLAKQNEKKKATGLVSLRFLGRQGARQSAASAVAGFAFLLFAVVGVGMWA